MAGSGASSQVNINQDGISFPALNTTHNVFCHTYLFTQTDWRTGSKSIWDHFLQQSGADMRAGGGIVLYHRGGDSPSLSTHQNIILSPTVNTLLSLLSSYQTQTFSHMTLSTVQYTQYITCSTASAVGYMTALVCTCSKSQLRFDWQKCGICGERWAALRTGGRLREQRTWIIESVNRSRDSEYNAQYSCFKLCWG